jgi:hypothetical protein
MTNPKSNSASHSHRPITPVAMAASIAIGIAGGGLVPVNPALARMPDSMPLATGVAPGLVADGVNLPDSLQFVGSLATSDMLVPQAGPQDPIRGFWRWLSRFFFFNPNDPI